MSRPKKNAVIGPIFPAASEHSQAQLPTINNSIIMLIGKKNQDRTLIGCGRTALPNMGISTHVNSRLRTKRPPQCSYCYRSSNLRAGPTQSRPAGAGLRTNRPPLLGRDTVIKRWQTATIQTLLAPLSRPHQDTIFSLHPIQRATLSNCLMGIPGLRPKVVIFSCNTRGSKI